MVNAKSGVRKLAEKGRFLAQIARNRDSKKQVNYCVFTIFETYTEYNIYLQQWITVATSLDLTKWAEPLKKIQPLKLSPIYQNVQLPAEDGNPA
jgi:hypothetical protein